MADSEFDRFLEESIENAKEALRPYGFYAAEIDGRVRRSPEGQAILELNVQRGPAVRIEFLQVEIVGEGANSRTLTEWRRNWPLKKGDRLNQVTWTQQKQLGLEAAASVGFLEPNSPRTSWRLISSATAPMRS